MPKLRDISESAPLDHRVRTLCPRCDGTGQEIEYRVRWKKGFDATKCWQRCPTEDDAREKIAELKEQGMVSVELISSASPCKCREPKKLETEIVIPDFKSRAAGEPDAVPVLQSANAKSSKQRETAGKSANT